MRADVGSPHPHRPIFAALRQVHQHRGAKLAAVFTPDFLALSKVEADGRPYQQAAKTGTEAIAELPGNADLLLARGHRELGLREFAAAQKDLEAAVAADRHMLDAPYHLGLAH